MSEPIIRIAFLPLAVFDSPIWHLEAKGNKLTVLTEYGSHTFDLKALTAEAEKRLKEEGR